MMIERMGGRLAFCLMLCVPMPAAGASMELSVAQVFELAEQATASGDFDQAIAILKVATQDKNPDYRAEARVRIARLLERKGDERGAIYWYRQLLDEQPEAVAVRIELARALLSLGEEGAAAAELRRAEAVGLPREVSRAIRNASDMLWSNRPIGIDLSLGLAPDTNVNSATSSDTVTIFGLPFQVSDDGKAHSGVGLTFSADVVARQRLSSTSRLIIQAVAAGRVYRDNRFNDVSYSISAGPEIRLSRSIRVRPAVLIGRRIYATDKLYDFHGLSGIGQIAIDAKSQITVEGNWTDFDYGADRAGQSGPAYITSFAYDRAFSGRFAARTGISVGRAKAQDPQFSTKTVSGDLTLSRDMGHWTLWTRGSLTRLKGDAAYALLGVRRDDRIIEAEGGLIFRRLSVLGLSPQIRVSYTRAISPIFFFRYRRLRSEISLTKSL
jgi:outer membrane protein